MAVITSWPMFLNAMNAEGRSKDRDYIASILVKARWFLRKLLPQCTNLQVGAFGDKASIYFSDSPNIALKKICVVKNTKAN